MFVPLSKGGKRSRGICHTERSRSVSVPTEAVVALSASIIAKRKGFPLLPMAIGTLTQLTA